VSLIILCEPQCWGFEHASFNAAFLETARLAGPQAKLVFMGEGSHLSAVRCELVRNGRGSEAEQVEWQEIEIPPRELGGWPRIMAERLWCARALAAASAPDTVRLILCSLTPTGLLWLKGMLLTRRKPLTVLAIIHGVLASVEEPQPRGLLRWATSLLQVLRVPHPKQLTYLALGPSVRSCLADVLPRVAPVFEPVDLPYFMSHSVPETFHRRVPVRFGFLGVGRLREKGFDKFVNLAHEVAQTSSLAASEFTLVGFLENKTEWPAGMAGMVRDISYAPLTPDDYCARASQLTYAVGLAEPRHYRLAASASFLDALRYGKPCIYLRNCYVEHYFDRIGDIGYLCDSYEEARDLVFSILREFPESRYQQQCENIRRGRLLFEPESVTSRLSDILVEAGQSVYADHRPAAGDLQLARPQKGPRSRPRA
jgi:hypothetical protein